MLQKHRQDKKILVVTFSINSTLNLEKDHEDIEIYPLKALEGLFEKVKQRFDDIYFEKLLYRTNIHEGIHTLLHRFDMSTKIHLFSQTDADFSEEAFIKNIHEVSCKKKDT